MLKFKKLQLINFKGIESREVFFDEGTSSFEGPNGVGKTTIFDGICFVLFDKDSQGGSAVSSFRPIGMIPKKDNPITEVTLEMELLGKTISLKKEISEVWASKKGAEEVLKGYTVNHMIDGVPKLKKEFDEYLSHNMPGIKQLIHPESFLNDHWSKQREFLLEYSQTDLGPLEEIDDEISKVGLEVKGIKKSLTELNLKAEILNGLAGDDSDGKDLSNSLNLIYSRGRLVGAMELAEKALDDKGLVGRIKKKLDNTPAVSAADVRSQAIKAEAGIQLEEIFSERDKMKIALAKNLQSLEALKKKRASHRHALKDAVERTLGNIFAVNLFNDEGEEIFELFYKGAPYSTVSLGNKKMCAVLLGVALRGSLGDKIINAPIIVDNMEALDADRCENIFPKGVQGIIFKVSKDDKMYSEQEQPEENTILPAPRSKEEAEDASSIFGEDSESPQEVPAKISIKDMPVGDESAWLESNIFDEGASPLDDLWEFLD